METLPSLLFWKQVSSCSLLHHLTGIFLPLQKKVFLKRTKHKQKQGAEAPRKEKQGILFFFLWFVYERKMKKERIKEEEATQKRIEPINQSIEQSIVGQPNRIASTNPSKHKPRGSTIVFQWIVSIIDSFQKNNRDTFKSIWFPLNERENLLKPC